MDVMGFPSAIIEAGTVEAVSKVVQYSIKYCKPNGVELAVKSGGHSKSAVIDDTLCLSLNLLRKTELYNNNRMLISGGCLLGDIDKCLKDNNMDDKLLFPAGNAHNTGMGLIMHGGHGFWERVWG